MRQELATRRKTKDLRHELVVQTQNKQRNETSKRGSYAVPCCRAVGEGQTAEKLYVIKQRTSR